MPEKNKQKIGDIGKFVTFGGGDTKTSKTDNVQTSGVQHTKTEETKDLQTSTGNRQQNAKTYEHFNGDEPWGKDAETQTPQNAYTSVDTDAKVIEVADITLLGGPEPVNDLPDRNTLTLTRHSQVVPQPQDVSASMSQKQEDLQTSTTQDVGTSELQNVSMSSSPLVSERLSQDEQTSKRSDSQKKKSTRSPEKEEGRQTVYFNDPRKRRVLMALKFLERRDIGDIVSDALDLYVERSPLKSVLPAFLAAQEGNLPLE
jgi:hypothetical protein